MEFNLLVKRLPKLSEIALVYGVNVVILYTFSLWFSFNDMARNWILYMRGADILGVFAYIISGAFIESLTLITFLILLYILLPQSITQGRFVSHGTILTVTFLLALMLRDGTYAGISDILENTKMVFVFFVVSAAFLFAAAELVKPVKHFWETFADRCAIFLYIYMPLSAAAVMIVLIRNIG